MDTLDAIFTRRSVRQYTDEPISKDAIQTLLKAAMYAPSAGNQQPWHFVVVTERTLLDKIAKIHPHAAMCKNANLAIVTCGDPRLQKHEGFWPEDLAAATQNILLAARALNLGAVWLGTYPREQRAREIGAIFEVPEEIIPFSIVALGHTKIEQKQVDRYKSERVHWNNWHIS